MCPANVRGDLRSGQAQLPWICSRVAITVTKAGAVRDTRPVARAIAIFLLVVVTLDLSGLGAVAGDACGSDECPVGSSGGPCSPFCNSCGCCSLPKATAPAARLSLVIPEGVQASWPGDDVPAPSPDPAAILHIPKLLA